MLTGRQHPKGVVVELDHEAVQAIASRVLECYLIGCKGQIAISTTTFSIST